MILATLSSASPVTNLARIAARFLIVAEPDITKYWLLEMFHRPSRSSIKQDRIPGHRDRGFRDYPHKEPDSQAICSCFLAGTRSGTQNQAQAFSARVPGFLEFPLKRLRDGRPLLPRHCGLAPVLEAVLDFPVLIG